MNREDPSNLPEIPFDIASRATYVFGHLHHLAGIYDGDWNAREHPKSVTLAVREIQEWLAYRQGLALAIYTQSFTVEITRDTFGVAKGLPMETVDLGGD